LLVEVPSQSQSVMGRQPGMRGVNGTKGFTVWAGSCANQGPHAHTVTALQWLSHFLREKLGLTREALASARQHSLHAHAPPLIPTH